MVHSIKCQKNNENHTEIIQIYTNDHFEFSIKNFNLKCKSQEVHKIVFLK